MIGFVLVIVVAFATFFPVPAYAIPSPDLIVGSLSSLSQIAMLAAAVVGGLAMTSGRLTFGRGTPAPISPRRRLVLWIALAVMVLSFGGNLYQYLARDDARLARFQATLVRPSHNPGEPILDPTLKEESYSEQIKDPNGITTQELAALLQKADQGQAADTNFIDIRETGETQLGELRHFTPVRWPDLSASGIDFKNKRNVLICHNGNRSSETCAALSAQGIPCNFVIGGLEKWIAEGGSMSNSRLRSPDQLRGVPSYRNDSVFLSTAAVHELIDHEHALVIDARYPGEFEHGHIPGAINIPIRRLPTAVLKTRIAALPRQPVVLACYDRRSCFMSTVLGLELSRAGFDVRGRYTMPWEYYIATPEPPYVAAWRDRVGATVWTKASRTLGKGVVWLADRGIGLPAAIVLLALLSRLLVLPVSLKAERDQATLKTLSGEIAALKRRLGGDGRRFSRALSALHRRHGMTPGRNLLALAFLPVLALSVAAVNAAVHERPQALWWMSDLGSRDHTLLMPAAFSALVILYLLLSVARTRKQRIASLVIGFPAFTGLAFYLNAGADLYMVASAGLMLLQRAIVAINLAPLRQALVLRRARRGGVIRLAEAHLARGCGNKAERLGVILSHGLPAPDGLVLTAAFLARLGSASEAERRRQLDRLWRRSGRRPLAVRSSAEAEDGTERSFAGVFESVLNVDRGGLAAAIAAVEASFTARTESYGAEGAGNIILQPMIAAEYAGVLFTEAPTSFGLAMVEMVPGTADAFVAGAAAPETYLLGRCTGRLVGDAPPPVDLAPLIALGRRIEAIFGAPQDIEWAYCDGRFSILQSRDITRTQLANNSKALRRERERARVLAFAAAVPGESVSFAQNEISELLPRPTPLSLDLMQSLWQAGGSVDLACRMLRLRYFVDDDSRPYLVSVFGRLYVDCHEEHRRAVQVGPQAAMQLRRTGKTIERDYQEHFASRAGGACHPARGGRFRPPVHRGFAGAARGGSLRLCRPDRRACRGHQHRRAILSGEGEGRSREARSRSGALSCRHCGHADGAGAGCRRGKARRGAHRRLPRRFRPSRAARLRAGASPLQRGPRPGGGARRRHRQGSGAAEPCRETRPRNPDGTTVPSLRWFNGPAGSRPSRKRRSINRCGRSRCSAASFSLSTGASVSRRNLSARLRRDRRNFRRGGARPRAGAHRRAPGGGFGLCWGAAASLGTRPCHDRDAAAHRGAGGAGTVGRRARRDFGVQRRSCDRAGLRRLPRRGRERRAAPRLRRRRYHCEPYDASGLAALFRPGPGARLRDRRLAQPCRDPRPRMRRPDGGRGSRPRRDRARGDPAGPCRWENRAPLHRDRG